MAMTLPQQLPQDPKKQQESWHLTGRYIYHPHSQTPDQAAPGHRYRGG